MEIPTEITEKLLAWYRVNARDLPWRRTSEPYPVWISEIMLQQTRVEAVKQYFLRFTQALPDVQSLAQVDEAVLMKLWEGLGYYSRARNLHKAANVICEAYGGVFPSQFADIQSLPGIGPYTAGAIASICFDLREPAVDGNVMRVISRVTANKSEINQPRTRRMFTEALRKIYPTHDSGLFTQSLMELGAIVCTPRGKPKCERCPLIQNCLAYQQGEIEQYPVKAPSRAKRMEERTVWLLTCRGKTALRKRADKGLLVGMWELPNQLGVRTAQEALRQVQLWGLSPTNLIQEVTGAHIFTHIVWQMTAFAIECKEETGDFIWATSEELERKYTLPTAFRIFF